MVRWNLLDSKFELGEIYRAVGPTEFLNGLLEFLVLIDFLMVHDLFSSSLTTYTRSKIRRLTNTLSFFDKFKKWGRQLD